jgi:predicted  nucleic acid-binding Zn-ribbon protein
VLHSLLAQEEKEREAAAAALVTSQQEASKLTAQVAEAERSLASLREQLQKVCAARRRCVVCLS